MIAHHDLVQLPRLPRLMGTSLLRQGNTSANTALCILLGVERSNSPLFENSLPILLRQVQFTAFSTPDPRIAREALLKAFNIYAPAERAGSCQIILASVHALLVASVKLCETENTMMQGVSWTCFMIEYIPIVSYLTT